MCVNDNLYPLCILPTIRGLTMELLRLSFFFTSSTLGYENLGALRRALKG